MSYYLLLHSEIYEKREKTFLACVTGTDLKNKVQQKNKSIVMIFFSQP